ncbi:Aldo/keto reductase [Mycena albidolilacea]|uniref:Aldo/keto reductase n=1 Tax=Mycena albidolilacea TaxID=1033008 RepID=A0AAD6YX17_9AGAR|nr:Aldo/keto reductase [Mycena albidolilacea]
MPTSTITRKIGDSTFPGIGFGVLDAAHAAGATFWDTADICGDSEELLGKWHAYLPSHFRDCWLTNSSEFRFKRTGKHGDIFLASKFGFTSSNDIDGSPGYVTKATESSLKKLSVDYIDLYYLHRADVKVPIEHTVAALAEFVKAGKIKHIGLSEVSAETLRCAHAVHPIAALQVEYSPFTLDIEDPKIGLSVTARELGIQVVAYSPLGRGFLTGQYKSPDDFEEGDFCKGIPRYSAQNFPNILKLADGLKSVGAKYGGATTGQVALAWLLAQGEDIIPIPENIAASKLKLSAEDVKAVRNVASQADASQGERYPAGMLMTLLVDTPALS